MSYASAHEGRTSTYITDITTDDSTTVDVGGDITFEPYGNPNISVTSSARFATHEIIGGTTVRQKLGEDPTEVSMDGVCTEEVASEIDQLRDVLYVTLISERLDDDFRCQVASVSTDPLEDGGAADMDQGEFLYEFNINMIKVDIQV